jgi:hypothetical protein
MSEPLLVDIGWRNCSAQAALAYFPPEPIGKAERELAKHLFPADGPANDLAHRIVQVRCPYDLTIRISPPGIWPARHFRVPEEGGLSEEGFEGLVTPVAPSALRDKSTPAVEVSLNLMIVTEETCTLHLMPPFLSPSFRDWPGTVVSGQFPVRSWPRPLNCVLEWQDRGRNWVLRRGDPMVYLQFDFDDPAKRPRMVEAAMTAPLERHFPKSKT